MDTVQVLDIPEKNGMDRITVFWRNWELGRGQVAIAAYGSAWTASFNAMGDRTIQKFFADASVDYMAGKLIDYRFQKRTQPAVSYLERVVVAVKSELQGRVEKTS